MYIYKLSGLITGAELHHMYNMLRSISTLKHCYTNVAAAAAEYLDICCYLTMTSWIEVHLGVC